MNWWAKFPRKSARVLIVEDGKLLTFHRKRHSRKTGEWIEYYSIPGGGIEEDETPESAAVRELYEEMGIRIRIGRLVAHRTGAKYEHFIYTADIVEGTPELVLDSEEARGMHSANQFIVEWVPVDSLSREKLRYYSDYLGLIRAIHAGGPVDSVLRIDGS